MSARTPAPCLVTGFDCLTCVPGCCLLRRPEVMSPRVISALLSQDPSIPAPRLALAPSAWSRLAAAARRWGWRGALEDLIGLVSLLALCWAAALILAAFGPDYGSAR